MKKGKNKKKVAVLATGLALLTLAAGTFAWTSYTEWTKNHMQSKGFENGRVTVVEDFKPETPIDSNDPTVAAKIDKKVNVGNFSSDDAFVRVSFEEMLHKLDTGAAKKAYETQADAKFPVIVDNSKYYAADGTLKAAIAEDVDNGISAETGYKDITAQLKMFDEPDGTEAATLPAGLKLIIEVDDKGKEIGNPILIAEKRMIKEDFPKDFDFKGKTGTVPVITGDLETAALGTEALVAQRVTGKLTAKKDGAGKYTYELYTANPAYTGATAEDNFGFYGFGVNKETAATDADWAGVEVYVATPATTIPAGQVDTTTGVIKSLTDPQIKLNFTPTNIVTTVPTTPTDVWYYNAADGYFYWCNVIKTGDKTSKNLINEVEFPAMTDDPTYYIASYNLWVGLESIPAAVDPLTQATKGGALVPTSTTDGLDKTWVSNNSGWGLVASGTGTHANDTDLIKLFTAAKTIDNIK